MYSVLYKEIVVCVQIENKKFETFECNFFATVSNAQKANLWISEPDVSKDLLPIQDTNRTDFENYKTRDSFSAAAILQV